MLILGAKNGPVGWSGLKQTIPSQIHSIEQAKKYHFYMHTNLTH